MKDEIKIGAAIAILFLFVSVLLIYFIGMGIQKKLARKKPDHPNVTPLSWREIVPTIIPVLCMFVGLFASNLAPKGLLGSFLSVWYGWVIYMFLAFLLGLLLYVPLNANRQKVSKKENV